MPSVDWCADALKCSVNWQPVAGAPGVLACRPDLPICHLLVLLFLLGSPHLNISQHVLRRSTSVCIAVPLLKPFSKDPDSSTVERVSNPSFLWILPSSMSGLKRPP